VQVVVVGKAEVRSAWWTFSEHGLFGVGDKAGGHLPALSVLATRDGAARLFGMTQVPMSQAASDAYRVVAKGSERRWRIPPYDEIDNPLFDQLPKIEGADVSVNLVLVESPFGTLNYSTRFVDGMRSSASPNLFSDADVELHVCYDRFLRHRLGELDVLSAVAGGHVRGDLPKLSVLAGLVSGPEYRAAWSSSFPGIAVLAKWSCMSASPGYEDVRRWVGMNTEL
jgi:hypothetical protein